MSLTIPNPTYAGQGPTKTGQMFAANELSDLNKAIMGRVSIGLDGSIKTGTINFIDGTQTVFATGIANAYPNQGTGSTVAPVAVTANIVGASGANATANLEAIAVNTGTPTTTGFPFYLTAAGTTATAQTNAISSWSITSNVITFSTAASTESIGQIFTVSGLVLGSYLNGLTFTSLGNTSGTVTANYTHANVTTQTEVGSMVLAPDNIVIQFTAFRQ